MLDHEGKVSVRYANGSARVKTKILFFRSSPAPGPGSVVTVPATPRGEPINVLSIVASVSQIVASTLALVVLVKK